MTKAPTLKIHKNKIVLCLIVLFQISCASLYLTDNTYNLRGKVSITDNNQSFLFNIRAKISKHSVNLKFYDPTGTQFITELNSNNNNWEDSKDSFVMSYLQAIKPMEIYALTNSKCKSKRDCKITQDFNNKNVKILVSLTNV